MTYKREKARYTEDLEFEEIKLEDIDLDVDPIGIHYNSGKGTWEYEERMAFQSLVSALNDLVKGHKEVLHAINKLVLKLEQGQHNLPISLRERGSTSSSGNNAYAHMQNTPLIYNKPSRPTMPHFLEHSIAGLVMPVEPSEPFGAYL